MYHRSKVQEQPFYNMPRRTRTFNAPLQVYGSDVPLPPKKEVEKAEKGEGEEEDRPAFKPSHPGIRGIHKTFEKFPDYLPNPPKELKRKIVADDAPEEKPSFKIPKKGISGPTTSIATNYRNLKASFPSAFRR